MKMPHKCILIAFIIIALSSSLIPSNVNAMSKNTDQSVLKIAVSNEPSGISYSNEAGILSGPKSFAVYSNDYYILDASKKLIYICSNNKIVNKIDLSFTKYPMDIRVDKNNIYILDGNDKNTIFTLDKAGNVKSKNDISKLLSGAALFLDMDNNKLIVTDTNGNRTVLNQQLTINKTDITNNMKTKLSNIKSGIITLDSKKDVPVNVNETLGSLIIQHKDKNNNTFVSMEEVADTSKIIVEQTLKEYDNNGKLVGTARIPLEKYYAFPNRFVDIDDNGNGYCLVLGKDTLEILKLELSTNFSSKLGQEKQAYLKEESLTKSASTKNNIITPASIGVTRYQASTEADYLINDTWTIHSSNLKSMSSVTIPTQLRYLSDGASAKGIPYCWGGFDGDRTSSSSNWFSFYDAMSKGINAGNTYCSGYYKYGTAGLDCSGFVSATYKFSSKWGTGDFYYDSSIFTTISTSSLRAMDILVSGSHIVLVASKTSSGINTAECTTSGSGELCKYYFRSWSDLSSYIARTCF